MSIIPPNRSHPAWCDTQLCSAYLYQDGSVSYEHRSNAASWQPTESLCSVVAWATQLVEHSTCGATGRVNVTLATIDEASSVVSREITPTVDIDLSPSEARRLAAQLLNVADEVDVIRGSMPQGANA